MPIRRKKLTTTVALWEAINYIAFDIFCPTVPDTRGHSLQQAKWNLLEALRSNEISAVGTFFKLDDEIERKTVPTDFWGYANAFWDTNRVESGPLRFDNVTLKRSAVEALWPLEADRPSPIKAEISASHYRKASPRQIHDAISRAYDMRDKAGLKPQNVVQLPQSVLDLLNREGLTTTKSRIQELAGDPRHSSRRLKPGERWQGK